MFIFKGAYFLFGFVSTQKTIKQKGSFSFSLEKHTFT